MVTIEFLLSNVELPDSPTPRLDAELLLAQALGKSRGYLHTWPEREPEAPQLERYQAALARRRAGEPVAYILGRQGFWSLDLDVASHTLIPRPDTELLVETALALLPATPLQVLDLEPLDDDECRRREQREQRLQLSRLKAMRLRASS